ncbi:hypothetical protein ACQEU6_22670 [Spirillospora sp. CA-108201]
MTDGTSNLAPLAPLTDEQYTELTRVSGGVDRAGYDAYRQQCPDVSHEEFVGSQTQKAPWPLYAFAAVREVATAEEAEEVWTAARERRRTDEFLFGYNCGRKADLAHADILSADEAGVRPFEYTRLRQEGRDHDAVLAVAGRQSDK